MEFFNIGRNKNSTSSSERIHELSHWRSAALLWCPVNCNPALTPHLIVDRTLGQKFQQFLYIRALNLE